jgi:serine/threonine protein kinase
VYESCYKDTKLAAKVLIQRHSDSDVARKAAIMNEVHILSKLKHQFIVKLVGACSVGENLCLCMEYSEYGSLSRFIHEDRRL